jgi:hypothetical protein
MLAEHTTENGARYTVDEASPDFALGIYGSKNDESVIYFDYVEVHNDSIAFFRHGDILVGEIYDPLKNTDVRRVLRAIEACEL